MVVQGFAVATFFQFRLRDSIFFIFAPRLLSEIFVQVKKAIIYQNMYSKLAKIVFGRRRRPKK